MRYSDSKKRYIIWGMPFLAALFVLLYIRGASCDVVYSDYIRLVNSYLPDALDPRSFLRADVLSRIPFTYLARWCNVTLFHYSLTFDRVLGVAGLLLMGVMLCRYLTRMGLGMGWSLLLVFLAFSLNKWEMLLNGSGYAHFIAFGLFFYQFLILERVYTGTPKGHDRQLLCVLPWIITLGVAGPYCAVYTVVLVLAYLFMWGSGNRNVEKKYYARWLVCTILPLMLYMLSDHFAVYEHAGAKDIGLLEALTGEFPFFPKFLLNGLASTVLGGETIQALMEQGILTVNRVYLLGAVVALGYVFAIWLVLRLDLYQKTIFPLILLVSGMGNHGVVLLGRYIFLDETYAWTSRYALQYQAGILGMLLIFALALRELKGAGRHSSEHRARQTASGLGGAASGMIHILVIFFSLVFLAGNCYTTYQEVKKMPYREQSYEAKAQAALLYQSLDDQTLADLFEYRKGADQIREAFSILEENHLNVFH